MVNYFIGDMMRLFTQRGSFGLLLTAVLTFLSSVTAVIHDDSFQPDVVLHVSSISLAQGCTQRPSVVVNGTSPGPLLRLQENKTTWIRVYNDMYEQNVTMHWHGISLQSIPPFNDGTPRASQWPIAPRHYFDYEVKPTVGEAGTYFYHSHVQFQSSTAHGPLIVEDASGEPPFEYDEERIVFLSEHFNKTDQEIVQGLQAVPLNWSGETETILVNGNASPIPNATEKTCGPEVFHVQPSRTYRFRFIGGAALSLVTLGFEKHTNLQVISADGSYTKPYTTDHMQVAAGQRFDVLLKTMNADELKKAGKTSFWIQMETRERPTNVTSFALLSYNEPETYGSSGSFASYTPGKTSGIGLAVPKNKVLTLPQNVVDWLEYALEPLKPNGFPDVSKVTRTIYLSNMQVAVDETGKNASTAGSDWDINGYQWLATSPSTPPYLVSIYEKGQSAIPSIQRAIENGGRDPRFNAYPAAVGEVLDIILVNEVGYADSFDTHPWHAHGAHFYDLGSGNGTYDPTANEKRLDTYTPVKRDTTMLYKYTDSEMLKPSTKGGWRAWRLVVQDAGVWMVHCHTLQHMLMGQQTVWVMGNASQITSKGLPENRDFYTFGDNYTSKEMAAYLQYKGAAYGNNKRSPDVNHFFSD